MHRLVRSLAQENRSLVRRHVHGRWISSSPALWNRNLLGMSLGGSQGGGGGGYAPIPTSKRSLPINFGVRIVPQQSAWVIERFGKFHKILEPGLHFLIPIVDKIAYVHSLKEEAFPIPNQQAITRDNVTINIDGVLYIRIVSPYDASYGVSDAIFAVVQLAQTTMRSELGKITLDKTFEERENLNNSIVKNINDAARAWGIECLRYEIRDISPPPSVRQSMDLQAEAERRKRAEILQSEGDRQAQINEAEGQKAAVIMKAEADAQKIKLQAEATAAGLSIISKALETPNGRNATALRIAEQYVEAFGNLAKTSNSILLPANAADPASMVAQALTVFSTLSKNENILPQPKGSDSSGGSSSGSGGSSSSSSQNGGSPSGNGAGPTSGISSVRDL